MSPHTSLVFVVAVLTTVTLAVPAAADDIALVFPQDPEKTTFSNTWHAPRSGGRHHLGTDLIAPKLTRVYAAADGVVIKISESPRAGRYVILGHDDGWETYYIHLNDDVPGRPGRAPWLLTLAPGVAEGVELEAGQVIGWVGDSGNAKGGVPHTHFELHRNGRPINPYPYLVAAWERSQTGLLPLAEFAPHHSFFYID